MDNIENKRELLEKCTHLKTMPHVYEGIKCVWGYPEFFEHMESLLLVEVDRETRAGFPDEVHREINLLNRTFMDYPEEVMAPELDKRTREKIITTIKDMRNRSSFGGIGT